MSSLSSRSLSCASPSRFVSSASTLGKDAENLTSRPHFVSAPGYHRRLALKSSRGLLSPGGQLRRAVVAVAAPAATVLMASFIFGNSGVVGGGGSSSTASGSQCENNIFNEGGRTYYVVQRGDTLTAIATQTGSTVEIIMQANQLQSDLIKPGQQLWVPRTYTIQQGDTLYAIARAHGTSVEEILKINNIVDANVISTGDIMLLP